MKLTYDREFNIAYLQFEEKSEQFFGIELLNANEQLGGSSGKELTSP